MIDSILSLLLSESSGLVAQVDQASWTRMVQWDGHGSLDALNFNNQWDPF